MSRANENVRTYFDGIPAEWDALYSHENRGAHIFNRMFRPDLYERYRFTFTNCGPIEGASVLDIGCGTGRYSIEFARRGASKVVGIDFSEKMVDFSHRSSEQMAVQDRCSFLCADLMSFPTTESFDIVVAIGFFDYISDPQTALNRISLLTGGSLIASFPRNLPVWGLQRRIRYHLLKNCPIYNYTETQLHSLLANAGFEKIQTKRSHTGYLVVARHL